MKFCGIFPFSVGVTPRLSGQEGHDKAELVRKRNIAIALAQASYRDVDAVIIGTYESALGYEWRIWSSTCLSRLLQKVSRDEYDALSRKHHSFSIMLVASHEEQQETLRPAIDYAAFLAQHEYALP
jgi:hypothetical protein